MTPFAPSTSAALTVSASPGRRPTRQSSATSARLRSPVLVWSEDAESRACASFAERGGMSIKFVMSSRLDGCCRCVHPRPNRASAITARINQTQAASTLGQHPQRNCLIGESGPRYQVWTLCDTPGMMRPLKRSELASNRVVLGQPAVNALSVASERPVRVGLSAALGHERKYPAPLDCGVSRTDGHARGVPGGPSHPLTISTGNGATRGTRHRS